MLPDSRRIGVGFKAQDARDGPGKLPESRQKQTWPGQEPGRVHQLIEYAGPDRSIADFELGADDVAVRVHDLAQALDLVL
ncbi:MAG TPA: hypothetical protein VGG01_01090, partial [Xanthobacteraceae bacterium]